MTNEATEADSKAPPALFDHCVNTYQAMLKQAKSVQISPDSEENAIVYEGFFTQLITGELHLSVPYYTSISSTLMRMGCIRQLKRGGGTSPSQWELLYEPTLDTFLNSRPKRTKKQTAVEMLKEITDTHTARITALEDLVQELMDALARQFGTTHE